MQLPKQITPCPIKEAVVEIRFESALPADATFGVVYNALKDPYSQIEKLPILQIPEILRAGNPDLVYQPYYKLKHENYILQIGPRTLSLAVVEPYPGWAAFLPEILKVFRKITELSFITRVSRFGLRYIDFFEGNIYENINLNLAVYGENAITDETFVRTKLQREQFNCWLQVGNQMSLISENIQAKAGSVIDVDTFVNSIEENFFEGVESLLQDAHRIQKSLFFELLKPEFLKTLNPIY
jgi:uncharacterized protein (TIGR04255 family)